MTLARAPSAPASVALIGCGAWGANLARCFAELGALAAVADRRPERAQGLAGRHGCRSLAVEAALADPAVGAVAIATAPASHGPLARAALDAGKHVLIEKPLTLDFAEARALVAAAAAARRTLMVGHLLRFHPAFIALQGLVASGGLGRLVALRSVRLNFGRIRTTEDALWCLAPHDVSMVLALTGSAPETVVATVERALGRPVADAAALRLGFPGSLAARIEVSWLHPVKEQRLTVVGDAAMAVFDDTAPWQDKLVLHPWRLDPHRGLLRGTPERPPLSPAEPLLEECRHFLACIATGAAPLTGPAEALAVMDVLSRAEAAARAATPTRDTAEPAPCPTI